MHNLHYCCPNFPWNSIKILLVSTDVVSCVILFVWLRILHETYRNVGYKRKDERHHYSMGHISKFSSQRIIVNITYCHVSIERQAYDNINTRAVESIVKRHFEVGEVHGPVVGDVGPVSHGDADQEGAAREAVGHRQPEQVQPRRRGGVAPLHAQQHRRVEGVGHHGHGQQGGEHVHVGDLADARSAPHLLVVVRRRAGQAQAQRVHGVCGQRQAVVSRAE